MKLYDSSKRRDSGTGGSMGDSVQQLLRGFGDGKREP
jgi:hypothetical protein